MEFEADVISSNYTDYSAKVLKGRRIVSEKVHEKALHDEKGFEYTDKTLFDRNKKNASRSEVMKNHKSVTPSSSHDKEPWNNQQDNCDNNPTKNDKDDRSASAENNDQQDDQQDQTMEGIEYEAIYINADKYKCTLVIDKVKQPTLDTAGALWKILTEKGFKDFVIRPCRKNLEGVFKYRDDFEKFLKEKIVLKLPLEVTNEEIEDDDKAEILIEYRDFTVEIISKFKELRRLRIYRWRNYRWKKTHHSGFWYSSILQKGNHYGCFRIIWANRKNA
jgi:hypothetical protein